MAKLEKFVQTINKSTMLMSCGGASPPPSLIHTPQLEQGFCFHSKKINAQKYNSKGILDSPLCHYFLLNLYMNSFAINLPALVESKEITSGEGQSTRVTTKHKYSPETTTLPMSEARIMLFIQHTGFFQYILLNRLPKTPSLECMWKSFSEVKPSVFHLAVEQCSTSI